MGRRFGEMFAERACILEPQRLTAFQHQLHRGLRRAVHLLFTGEKVRLEYPEPAPEPQAHRRIKGVRLIPLKDLIRMKLTSFRAKDEAHLKDLDLAGLVTADVEDGLSPIQRERLGRVRARD